MQAIGWVPHGLPSYRRHLDFFFCDNDHWDAISSDVDYDAGSTAPRDLLDLVRHIVLYSRR